MFAQTSKRINATRKFSDKFNALGVIVPVKHSFDPLKPSEFKAESTGYIPGDNKPPINEVNPLILTDERILPKRSVSVIGKSGSLESPRKVSNQSTKT